MTCPECGKKNVTAAHILGHAGKGKKKTISEADKQGRKERMRALNAARDSKKRNDQA
jgi:hypothetical protein